MLNGYRQFLKQIQPGGFLLYRYDLLPLIGKEVMDELDAKDVETFSFGIDAGNYHTSQMRVENGIWHWDIQSPWGVVQNLELLMPGRHNVLNATAASALVLNTGVTDDNLRKGLRSYKGVTRRFEIRYRDEQDVLIDDYAHHPEELKAAIMAAKETYGGPVTGVFQPHLYSRTRDLAKEFAEALDLLDTPVIIDIYPAREKPIEGVSSQTIYDLMKNPKKKWIKGDDWISWIIQQKPKVLITLGAGDLDKHIPELIGKLYKNE
jgi:UDP-N-acetylmuramate--alanine ligase